MTPFLTLIMNEYHWYSSPHNLTFNAPYVAFTHAKKAISIWIRCPQYGTRSAVIHRKRYFLE